MIAFLKSFRKKAKKYKYKQLTISQFNYEHSVSIVITYLHLLITKIMKLIMKLLMLFQSKGESLSEKITITLEQKMPQRLYGFFMI